MATLNRDQEYQVLISSQSGCSVVDTQFVKVVADSGNVKTRGFCPTCGSPVHLTFAAMPELFTVHAASLDDPGRYKPQMVTYHVRGHGWDRLDPSLPTFDRMPPA